MMAINFGMRAALAIIALIVIYIAGGVMYRKSLLKQFDRTFRFAAAITISWLGHLLFSAMFFTGQYVIIDQAQADKNGWTVPFVSLMLIVGGVMHIDNLTNEQGDKIWQYSLLAATLAGLSAYWWMSLR